MRRRASEHRVRLLREHEVTSVVQDAEGVTVATRAASVRAGYLVACDGAHSVVRKRLGMDFPGSAPTFTAVLAEIRLDAVAEHVPTRAGHVSGQIRQADGYWAMLSPLGERRYRFVFGTAEQPERGAPVRADEVRDAVRAVYGPTTRLGAVYGASRFADATRQLASYRDRRVLFAGDAAHVHSPLGGQGLNLGLQDAINLGWKLAATVRGDAPDGLLDSYHAERHPAGARVLACTRAQRVLAAPAPGGDAAALREIFVDLMRLPAANACLAGLMSGLDLHYLLPGEHPLTGHRVPDIELVAKHGAGRLSGLLRAGNWLLLELDGSSTIEAPVGTTRVAAKSTEDIGASALLLRPDGYVHAAGGDEPVSRSRPRPCGPWPAARSAARSAAR